MSPSSRSLEENDNTRSDAALRYAKQAEKLGYKHSNIQDESTISEEAVQAKFVTGQDPVIETASGERLPTVPVQEAVKLNELKNEMHGSPSREAIPIKTSVREAKDGTVHGLVFPNRHSSSGSSELPEAPLPDSVPQSKTNPLFPPMPVYGPPSLLRDVQCYFFRATAFPLSLCFLMVILLGSVFTCTPLLLRHLFTRLKLKDPKQCRPFCDEEEKRNIQRREDEFLWKSGSAKRHKKTSPCGQFDYGTTDGGSFTPLEGGPDPLVCDPGYYARRVGLQMEDYDVQTEDGFIIKLLHLYDPREDVPAPSHVRTQHSAQVFPGDSTTSPFESLSSQQHKEGNRKYPVLLMHGLLQSAGAFCCCDDNSLAFYLAKSGYDVWLGNNRCGFDPSHNLLTYEDPRMWAWNIRQMGVMDLPALISRVLSETGFEKTGLVCHSQGTTQTFVALAKEQRPDIGEKISVFCALAPAVYAGPLIKKFQFKIMRLITPSLFRMLFGIHSFIPFMMQMHGILPGRVYGWMGYRVFSFLFNWTDERWELALRDRLFQFSPTYVSAESMRWWLGRECFAKQKCILATRAEGKIEDEEDEEDGGSGDGCSDRSFSPSNNHHDGERSRYAWYDSRAPPFAFWIAGNDELVDGRRLVRRFEHGREPYVQLVHCKFLEEYEHLDVIWAMDSIHKVGEEVKDVIWKTAPQSAKAVCRVPIGIKGIDP